MKAKEKFKKITEYCRMSMTYLGRQIPFEVRRRLAELWADYIRELPPEVAEREALVILGYPNVVRLKDIPRKILEDPFFASLIIRMYGEYP